jgi:hypothetical protein
MRFSILVGFAAFGAVLVIQAPAAAHCDGLDGPVVTARPLQTVSYWHKFPESSRSIFVCYGGTV